MNGSDVMVARRKAGVSQGQLAKAMQLRGGRGALTDIENDNEYMELSERCYAKLVNLTKEISTQSQASRTAQQ